MARKDSDNQKKSMSVLFRGKAIFKPLNTGRIDQRVACVREWVANIFFYTKNGVTIMIDAGYNYARLKEKMSWLDIDPASIRHIFITHQDTDHVGALERDSELLFKDATVYIGEIENRYLTGEARRRVIYGLYKLPIVKTDNERVLLKDGQTVQIGDIKVECMLVPGHTWGHMVYLVDDEYLFTGDTIWFGADGGYSFLSTLAEDNDLAVQSLEKLENALSGRNGTIKIITGHTGWTDDREFAFRHRTELCEPFAKKYTDTTAPYDGYVEDDDTEEGARNVPLEKVHGKIKPDYKNWVPKGMIAGFGAGAA
ncbi:MAG: MBL fold metallo-hydrolase, partial [Firmicutes bacterium]|nr:MBL fold metallo-hydrolase [Bacillota bacterium]